MQCNSHWASFRTRRSRRILLSHCMQTRSRTIMDCPSFSETCCACVFNMNEKDDDDDDDDKDDEQSGELPNTWWKFMSTSKLKRMTNLQENTYFITSTERKKRVQNPRKPRRSLRKSNSPNCFLDREDEQR